VFCHLSFSNKANRQSDNLEQQLSKKLTEISRYCPPVSKDSNSWRGDVVLKAWTIRPETHLVVENTGVSIVLPFTRVRWTTHGKRTVLNLTCLSAPRIRMWTTLAVPSTDIKTLASLRSEGGQHPWTEWTTCPEYTSVTLFPCEALDRCPNSRVLRSCFYVSSS
jgi:hypothetical protein